MQTENSPVRGSSKEAVQNYGQQLNNRAIAECIVHQVFSSSFYLLQYLHN